MKMFSKSGYFQTEFIHLFTVKLWGRPYQNATCDISPSNYFVEEVLYLNFSQSGVAWKSTKDHSKWNISAHQAAPWVCYGEINKMTSQAKRGGSFFCMMNNQLWKMMSNAITQTQSFSNDEKKEKVTLKKLIYDAIQRKYQH